MSRSTYLILMIVAIQALEIVAGSMGSFAVYRSEDAGNTWRKSDANLPGEARINAFVADSQAIVCGTDRGIFLSRDRGLSWEPAEIGGLDRPRVIALASTSRDGVPLLWAATDASVLLASTNSGKSWQRNTSFPQLRVRSLHADGSTIYAGADVAQIEKSSDGGKTWTSLKAGLPASSQILSMTSIEGRLFAGLYAKGLFAWDAPEERWRQVGAAWKINPLVLANTQKTLIAGHNPGGIFFSEDLGESWERWTIAETFPQVIESQPNMEAPIWEMAADESLAIAGAADGIVISRDRGANWTRVMSGLPAKSPGIAFVIQKNLILAAIHEKSGR